ncbi:MAG: UDP-N-acetylmuramate dehydrogenase [Clostridiales bacterium]|nr:UDP-N-acetylmuramate dehydrogenase [Clostridiales bacterium]MCF8021359.1 UDP-N-acetylmuramate dehydrogenase [Clostridiales bacterium]
MISDKLYSDLSSRLTGNIKQIEPMHKHTSWRIGGYAEIFVDPAGTGDLQEVLRYSREAAVPFTIVGNCSNLLVSDKGVKGIVVKIGRGMSSIEKNDIEIIAGAGAKLSSLASFAKENEIGGFEFASGIPGTVGGAVMMNAGAHGSCMSDLLNKVCAVDYNGNIKQYLNKELSFSYRKSSLKNMNLIITGAVFRGEKSDKEYIDKLIRRYIEIRKNNQPLKYPNAGSVFKNPPGDSAGRLIDLAGGKGLQVGDAAVSTQHANFFINLGNASAADMMALIKKVKDMVMEKFNIELFLEVQVVGEL